MTFNERVKVKAFKLRQLATTGIGPNYGEAYRLFKEIEADSKCNSVLGNSQRVNKSMAEKYNEHIRTSNLSDVDKRDRTI